MAASGAEAEGGNGYQGHLPPQVMQGMRDVVIFLGGDGWVCVVVVGGGGRVGVSLQLMRKRQDFSWVCAPVISVVLKEIQNYKNDFHTGEHF